MILVTNVSSTRWCTGSIDDECALLDLSVEELANDFDSTFDAKIIGFDWSEIPDFPSEIKTSSRFKDVETINLSFLKIVNVRKIKFNNVNALTSLDLSTNGIVVLHDNVFEFVPTITSLYLFRNKITTIHNNAFNGLTKLETGVILQSTKKH